MNFPTSFKVIFVASLSCGLQGLSAACSGGDWTEVNLKSDVIFDSTTDTVHFGGFYELEKTTPVGESPVVYAQVSVAGHQQASRYNITARSSYENVKYSGSWYYSYESHAFEDNLRKTGYRDLPPSENFPDGHRVEVDTATSPFGEQISSSQRIHQKKTGGVEPASYYSPTWGQSPDDPEHSYVIFNWTGDAFKAAKDAGEGTITHGQARSAWIDNVTFSDPFEGHQGRPVTGSVTGQIASFTALLRFNCPGTWKITEEYKVESLPATGAFSIKEKTRSVSVRELPDNGIYRHEGEIPAKEGKIHTLVAMRFQRVAGCAKSQNSLGSIDWLYPLGDENHEGGTSGAFFVRSEVFPASINASLLGFANSLNNQTPVFYADPSETILREIKTMDSLLKISDIDLDGDTIIDGFEITIYDNSAVDFEINPTKADGFTLNTDAVARERFVFEDPDLGVPVVGLKRFRVSRFIGNSETAVSWVEYSLDDEGEWHFKQSDTFISERLIEVPLQEERVFETPTGDVVRRKRTVWRELSDGTDNHRVKSSETEWASFGTDGNGTLNSAATTFWQYYETGDDFGRVSAVIQPDGSWIKYTYHSDGTVARSVMSLGNNDFSTADSLNRVEFTSEVATPGDIRWHITEVKGMQVARSGQITTGGIDDELGVAIETRVHRRFLTSAAPLPASWNAGPYLEESTVTIKEGVWAGKLRSQERANGTRVFVEYEEAMDFDNQRLMTVERRYDGIYDGSTWLEGTLTETAVDLRGNSIYERRRDLKTNTLIASIDYLDPDDRGRARQVAYLDGTTETREYGCCGIESMVGREGILTRYYYDAAGEVYAQSVDGVTRTRTKSYDGDPSDSLVGLKEVAIRQGRDGALLPAGEEIFDGREQVVGRYDPVGNLTRYTYQSEPEGGYSEAVVLPSMETRKTRFFSDGTLADVTGDAAEPMRYEYDVVTDIHDGITFNAQITRTIRMRFSDDTQSYEDTAEFATEYRDMLGRVYRVESPDPSQQGQAVSTFTFYNALGQSWKSVDPDGLVNLREYNALGDVIRTALDLNKNDTIDLSGPDRISETRAAFVEDAIFGHAQRSESITYNETGFVMTQARWRDLDSLDQRVSSYDATTASAVAFDTPLVGQRTLTTTSEDGLIQTQVWEQTRLLATKIENEAGEVLSETTYQYDEFNRLQDSTDPRNGTTTYTYYADDQIQSIETPDPDSTVSGVGLDAQITSFVYVNDALNGIKKVTTLPDATQHTQVFDALGRLTAEYGSGVYPQEISYDHAGRMQSLTTWQHFDDATESGVSGDAVTTWTYNNAGLLREKLDAENQGPTYYYTPGGRLKQVQRARLGADGLNPISIRYDYDPTSSTAVYTSEIWRIVYLNDPAATPEVAHVYNRLGQLSEVIDASGRRERIYADGQLVRENYLDGPFAAWSIAREINNVGQMTELRLFDGPTMRYDALYQYQDHLQQKNGRLTKVAFGQRQWDYAYHTHSNLIDTLTGRSMHSVKTQQSREYDAVGRLTSITGETPVGTRSRTYQYDDLNRRTHDTSEDGTYWHYSAYDTRGQLGAAARFFNDGTPIPGHSYSYTFDDIGNRSQTIRNSHVASYARNRLNQYEQRDVPRHFPVWGQVSTAHSLDVTVNGVAAALTEGVFYGEAGVSPVGFVYPADVDSAYWFDVEVEATLVGGTADQRGLGGGKAYVPPHPEVIVHDADGNLTQDGRWHYTWNAENRLVAMETTDSAVTAGVPLQRLAFAYDSQGRRVTKEVFDWDATQGLYVTVDARRYLYDGWNLLAELDALPADPIVSVTYLWGLDLSGSLQGAGGVGGLLAVELADGSTYEPQYDGNGNVLAYVNVIDGRDAALFEYSPFGERIRATGSQVDEFNFRFSTKYEDAETSLLYYGYRYYDVVRGRWLSRDPIGEEGGLNLYGFVGNDGVNYVDVLGMEPIESTCTTYEVVFQYNLGNFFGNVNLGYVQARGRGRIDVRMRAKVCDSCCADGVIIPKGYAQGGISAEGEAVFSVNYGIWQNFGGIAEVRAGIGGDVSTGLRGEAYFEQDCGRKSSFDIDLIGFIAGDIGITGIAQFKLDNWRLGRTGVQGGYQVKGTTKLRLVGCSLEAGTCEGLVHVGTETSGSTYYRACFGGHCVGKGTPIY